VRGVAHVGSPAGAPRVPLEGPTIDVRALRAGEGERTREIPVFRDQIRIDS
jgi:hypothetical protein